MVINHLLTGMILQVLGGSSQLGSSQLPQIGPMDPVPKTFGKIPTFKAWKK